MVASVDSYVWGKLLLLLAVVVWALCRWMWSGPRDLVERACEAAQDGDTERLLHALFRLREKAARKAGCPSPESLASGLVCTACTFNHPDTAQALLDYLGLKRSELLWEEKGRPAIPLLEYVEHEPDLEETRTFLLHGGRD